MVLRFRIKRDCTIHERETKVLVISAVGTQLIRFIVFAYYEKIWISGDLAHVNEYKIDLFRI